MKVFDETAAYLWSEAGSVVEHHPTAARVLFLSAIFVYGYVQGAVFKQRDWACATWILGLLSLTFWIVLALMTTIGVLLGAVVLISGVSLMAIYYKKGPPPVR